MHTNPDNFVKTVQGIRPCVAFVFLNSVKFSVLGADPPIPAPISAPVG